MRLIIILCSVIFLFCLLIAYQYSNIYNISFSKTPWTYVYSYLPLILFPIAIFAFWKKKQIGWMLLTALVSFYSIDTLWTIYATYILRNYENPIDPGFAIPPPFIPYIIGMSILGLAVFKICRQEIREAFTINKAKMLATVAVSTAITLIWLTIIYS